MVRAAESWAGISHSTPRIHNIQMLLATLLVVLEVSIPAQATRLPGQTTLGSALPAAAGADPFQKSPESLDRPLVHVVRQFEDLPTPGSPLPLPATAEFERFMQSRPRPFSVDYVFMPRSDVSGAETGVVYNEIGFEYLWARPFWARTTVMLRPSADIVFLSGPAPLPDVPEQLYKVAVDLQLDVPVTETVGVSVGVTPGLWTDFVETDGDDFRLPARALLTFRVNDSLFLAGGVLYTDNIRRNVLPAVGVVWNPTNEWHLEVLYPRSRLVYRFNDDWSVYFVFERGGTTYNIRTNGQDEDMEYRDWRAMLGLEVSRWSGFDLFVEVGGAWERKFRFDIQPTADISDSFLLRVGGRF